MATIKEWLKKRNFILLILFLLVTFSTFAISLVNLGRFYALDELDYTEWTADLGNPFETDLTSNLLGKVKYVDFNGLMRRALGQPEMNGIIKLKNGYLVSPMTQVSYDTIERKANELGRVNQIMKSKGIHFLYVATPYAVSKYDQQLPKGYVESGNENIDAMLEALHERDVKYIDVREKIHENGLNQYDMWYKTDHHWSTEGAFFTFSQIVEFLEKDINLEIDQKILDESSYEKVTYEKWHLGSCGQRTGRFYAGVDDFTLYYPKFETDLNHVEFKDCMYDYEPLQNRNYMSRYTYDNVLGGSLGHWVNGLSSNDSKALVICDSMGKAIMPFISLAFSESMVLDANEITNDILNEYNPDVVLMILHPRELVEGEYQDIYYIFNNLE